MADQGEHYEKSWILHHIIDRMIGSRKLVDIRRKLIIMNECIRNEYEENEISNVIDTGGLSEGFKRMPGSDKDMMVVFSTVMVICSNQDIPLQSSQNRNMTLFVMRNAASRPCYVTLELLQTHPLCPELIKKSIVPVRDVYFISSEFFAEKFRDMWSSQMGMNITINGPAASFKSNGISEIDIVWGFKCDSWPPVANEWLNRRRQYAWPNKDLICDISQNGYVVPVGDKTSADTFLQWSISFIYMIW